MSRLDSNIEVIGKLKGRRSGNWEFQPFVRGEQVKLRFEHSEHSLGFCMEFKNRVEFSDWLDAAADDLGFENNKVGLNEMIEIMCAHT
jgi:hypothetical protein